MASQPVGERIYLNLDNKLLIIKDTVVLKILEEGYKLAEGKTRTEKVKIASFGEIVEKLLEKNIIEEVKNPQSPGYYSRLFLVPKMEQNKWRCILVLHHLNNNFILEERFKMETGWMDTNREELCKGEYGTSLDFTNAYFHIPIHKSYRNFMRFCIMGNVLQFRVLLLAITNAHQIITKIIKAFLQKRVIKVSQYLDD